jgi:hypothetical protein
LLESKATATKPWQVQKINFPPGIYPCTARTPRTAWSIEQSSKKGLDLILSHFQYFEDFQGYGATHWPRTVSTKATQGRQVVVTGKEEALAHFKAANYMDCRISAYPYWRASIVSRFAEIKNLIPPDLIMIDLDSCNFFDKRALLAALRQTLQKIKVKLALIPTVIWSGNGFPHLHSNQCGSLGRYQRV